VRGFTLLQDEFDAKRIHLQEGGQSPWYLSHELVHALIGPSWAPLPGILEEGLGDVIAETLNPEYENHIRSHRLLNSSAFTGGIELEASTAKPDADSSRTWSVVRDPPRPAAGHPVPTGTLLEPLRTAQRLHPALGRHPRVLYGISWFDRSRAVRAHRPHGPPRPCTRATAAGLELVPIAWLEDAADLRFDKLDPAFLASCFDRRSMQTALFLQPEAFAEVLIDALLPLHGQVPFSDIFRKARPAIRLANQSEVQVGTYSGPVYRAMRHGWQTLPEPATATTAP
jgi:hypothetical protein